MDNIIDLWSKRIVMDRDWSTVPIIKESSRVIVEYYLYSSNLVTIDKYGRDLDIKEGEVGYLFLEKGTKNDNKIHIYPIIRIINVI